MQHMAPIRHTGQLFVCFQDDMLGKVLSTVSMESSRRWNLCVKEQTLVLIHCSLKRLLGSRLPVHCPLYCTGHKCSIGIPERPIMHRQISRGDCMPAIEGEYYPNSPVEGSACAHRARVTIPQPSLVSKCLL